MSTVARSLVRWLAGVVLVAGLAAPALANGRDPFISTIHFKVGDDT
jgi:hypothetical protein